MKTDTPQELLQAARPAPTRRLKLLIGLAVALRGVPVPAEVKALAEQYGVTLPQLCIRYTLQLGTVSLPKTANPEHMRSNAEVDFEISEEDMATLEGLHARDYGDSRAFPVYSGK